jgi:sulfatase-modifying factor enzyme 1
MRKVFVVGAAVSVAVLLFMRVAFAGFCASDAVLAGTVCMDKYEASVWRVPDPLGANAGLVTKIQAGTATAGDLAAAGGTQLGTAGDNYAPCTANGQNCSNDIYAVSVAGVTPAAYITWFQAQEACANSAKRLPTSAEWQVAANGTPDIVFDDGTTSCNTCTQQAVVATGSRSRCVSARGAFDMVGNLHEWVADWVPQSIFRTAPEDCPDWSTFSNDVMCLLGADPTADAPGAVLRGGGFYSCDGAGPLNIRDIAPYSSRPMNGDLGFRCVRALSTCTDCTCDRNGDRQVTIDELIVGVNKALTGCQ